MFLSDNITLLVVLFVSIVTSDTAIRRKSQPDFNFSLAFFRMEVPQMGSVSFFSLQYFHDPQNVFRIIYSKKCVVKQCPISVVAGLSLEQVDALWNCLATDFECSDECFSWFLNQAKNKDHHAVGLEGFKHIFMEKVNILITFPLS